MREEFFTNSLEQNGLDLQHTKPRASWLHGLPGTISLEYAHPETVPALGFVNCAVTEQFTKSRAQPFKGLPGIIPLEWHVAVNGGNG